MAQFIITAPDWELLRKQKNTLINKAMECHHSECEISRAEGEDLEGLIHFIDSIQDSAVESGIWSEKEIFNTDVKKLYETLSATLHFNGSTKEEIIDFRSTFDFGILHIKYQGKTYQIDSIESSIGEDYSINVLFGETEDVISPNPLSELKGVDEAELYIGCEYEVEPDYITLSWVNGGCTHVKTINKW